MTSEISVPREDVAEFAGFGIRAFTTTREAGTFSLSGPDPVGEVMARWTGLQDQLSPFARRTVIGRQVHGSNVITHRGGWEGLLRTGEADGHLAAERGIVLTVSIADCVPIFMAHPSGIVGLLHSGWRGTVGRIVDAGINAFGRLGLPPDELKVHLGPAICGRCYEVSPDVYGRLTGRAASAPTTVDLRALIAGQARALGVRDVRPDASCTRCDHDRFFSHRSGDAGRQVSAMIAEQ
jgi:YfiH family protein